jgi:hypothetical protein
VVHGALKVQVHPAPLPVEQELHEELRFHLEDKIEEGIAHGLSPKEAIPDRGEISILPVVNGG